VTAEAARFEQRAAALERVGYGACRMFAPRAEPPR